MVPFHEIRSMSPEQFVTLLAKDLRASGVVAGRNYRFGKRRRSLPVCFTYLKSHSQGTELRETQKP